MLLKNIHQQRYLATKWIVFEIFSYSFPISEQLQVTTFHESRIFLKVGKENQDVQWKCERATLNSMRYSKRARNATIISKACIGKSWFKNIPWLYPYYSITSLRHTMYYARKLNSHNRNSSYFLGGTKLQKKVNPDLDSTSHSRKLHNKRATKKT